MVHRDKEEFYKEIQKEAEVPKFSGTAKRFSMKKEISRSPARGTPAFPLAVTQGLEKTMNIKRAREDGKYWVIYGDYRLWAVLSADIPLPASVLIETKK